MRKQPSNTAIISQSPSVRIHLNPGEEIQLRCTRPMQEATPQQTQADTALNACPSNLKKVHGTMKSEEATDGRSNFELAATKRVRARRPSTEKRTSCRARTRPLASRPAAAGVGDRCLLGLSGLVVSARQNIPSFPGPTAPPRRPCIPAGAGGPDRAGAAPPCRAVGRSGCQE
jgi:hypothetical protein